MAKAKAEKVPQQAVRKKKEKGIPEKYRLFLIALPFLVLVFIFSYLPLYGWRYAFYDYKPPLKLSQCDYVGFKWFTMLFRNKGWVTQIVNVLKNTFAMSGLGILVSVLPVAFAIFLSEIKCKWAKNLIQKLHQLGYRIFGSIQFILHNWYGKLRINGSWCNQCTDFLP